MRTTFDIPDELLKKAQKLLGIKSKREVVIFSLKELIRRKEVAKIVDLVGRYEFEIDPVKSRRRHGSN